MTAPGAVAIRAELRPVAASAWVFRCRVELEAEARFERLAARMERLGDPVELVALARGAAADERRHAALCAEEAGRLGEEPSLAPVRVLPEIAPAGASPGERVLYELTAASCISETESVTVLTALLEAARAPGLRRTLRALARDEVRHARLGWAYLAQARAAGRDLAFLGPLVPAMLAGSIAPDLFEPGGADEEDDALLALGVLPRRRQREAFVGTLEEVVLPGLEGLGIDGGPARGWLAERRARAGGPDAEPRWVGMSRSGAARG